MFYLSVIGKYIQRDSTNHITNPVLVENVEELLSTFTQVCFNILSPVGLVTIRSNPSSGNEIWKKILKPHNFRPVDCCLSSVAQFLSRGTAFPKNLGYGFLRLSQIWLLYPRVIWMGTKTLDCNNAVRFITDMIRTSILFLLLYFWSVVVAVAVGPNIEACLLDSIFGAQHRN